MTAVIPVFATIVSVFHAIYVAGTGGQQGSDGSREKEEL